MPAAGLPPRRSALDRLLLLGAVVASLVAWRTLPQSFFHADDFMNLFGICDAPLPEYLLSVHAGHALVVRNAAFWLFARAFGTDAAAYFTVVLLTHLLNVALLFRVLRRATRSPWLAAAGALLFGTCPVAEGSLAWYAVYGHVLATTALLLVLDVASRAAARGRALTGWEAALASALMLAATLSFGTGVALALALPAALALLLPLPPGRARWRLPLLGLWVLVPLAYAAAQLAYDRVADTAYVAGVGTLIEAATDHWGNVVRLWMHLVGYGSARLLAGPWPLPFAFPPLTVAGLFAVVAASLAGAWRGDAATRRWLAAGWLLTLATYGIIAVGRVLWWSESGFAMADQARYHYAGLATLAVVVTVAARGLWPRGPQRAGAAAGLFGLWAVALAGAHAAWPPAPDLHRASRQETLYAVRWMEQRIAAAPPGADVYLVNRVLHAGGGLFVGMEAFPGWAGLFVIYFPDNQPRGRRVHFIEADAAVRAHHQGRRTRGLFIAPDDVPPGSVPPLELPAAVHGPPAPAERAAP